MRSETKSSKEWVPYTLPIAIFLGVTFLEGQYPKAYVPIYFAKIALVICALIWARSTWKDVKWEPKYLPLGVVVGLVLFGVWIGLEKYVHYPHMGDRTAYNPWEQIPDAGMRSAFLAVRFFGLVLLVPFMEEIFWRSFGFRYGSRSDFNVLPVGSGTEAGALLSVIAFALAHPEWLSALIFGAVTTYVVWRTKSLFACVVIHVVTNLALGIYVVTTGAWALW